MKLALRLMWRDWRSGELRILFAGLVIAISVVTGVAAFAERLQRGIDARSATFLAGDLVVRSRQPFVAEWSDVARDLELRTANIVRFPTMSYAGERLQLVSVSAVSDEYPLLGTVRISEATGDPGQDIASGPAPGNLWADPRLLTLLEVKVGQSIGIGETSLRVDALLINEPDASTGMFALGPRLIMHTDDLTASGIIQPGSRIEYNLVVAGERSALNEFKAWLEPRLLAGHRLVELDEGQPGLGRTVGRVRQFLLMAACLAVILAGVAVAMAARRYGDRHTDYVAILKTLGLNSRRVAGLYLVNFASIAMLATIIGWLLGWIIQQGIFIVLSGLLDVDMPPAGLSSLGLGAATGFTCLFSFALPPLLPMLRAVPLRVLRRDLDPAPAGMLVYLFGLIAIAALMYQYTGDAMLTSVLLGSVVLCALMVGGSAWLLLRYSRLLGMQAGSSWRLARAGLQRHMGLNAIQVLAFSVTLMLLLVLAVVRGRLLDDWSGRLEEGRPNHFLLNIAESQIDGIEQWINAEGLEHAGLYPMVPGRLIEINGKPIKVDGTERVNLGRDFNLSWSSIKPPDNRLQAGRWWSQDDGDELSVEKSVADTLELELDDRLTMEIAGQRINGRLSSIRELDWDSMRPNFYILMQPELLRDHPATWLTSFFLAAERKSLLVEFSRAFPTVTIIEMDVMLARATEISQQAAMAVQLVLGVALIAGALVLLASVQAGLDARYLENAVLRSLGARRRLLLGSLLLEFALLGLIAGSLAALGTELATWVLQSQVLDLDYRSTPWVWLAGPVLGTALVAGLGVLSCRGAVDTPPVEVLRRL